MKKIVGIFSIFGVFVSAFSAYIAYLALMQDSSNIEGNTAHIIQWKVAQAISPEGYTVSADKLEIIHNNVEFMLGAGDSVLLSKKDRIPFSVRKSAKDRAITRLDGRQAVMLVGDKKKIPNTECYVWMHKIEKEKFKFHLRCDNA